MDDYDPNSTYTDLLNTPTPLANDSPNHFQPNPPANDSTNRFDTASSQYQSQNSHFVGARTGSPASASTRRGVKRRKPPSALGSRGHRTRDKGEQQQVSEDEDSQEDEEDAAGKRLHWSDEDNLRLESHRRVIATGRMLQKNTIAIVRDQPKWNRMYNEKIKSKGAQAGDSDNADVGRIADQEVRPIGTKASKANAKGKVKAQYLDSTSDGFKLYHEAQELRSSMATKMAEVKLQLSKNRIEVAQSNERVAEAKREAKAMDKYILTF
uniref:No apical meristem-associated C-terminal domain-containing protein n=1 Tax=Oryza brachyantha TaxID=4533 RepID=J3KUR1_ORYBR